MFDLLALVASFVIVLNILALFIVGFLFLPGSVKKKILNFLDNF